MRKIIFILAFTIATSAVAQQPQSPPNWQMIAMMYRNQLQAAEDRLVEAQVAFTQMKTEFEKLQAEAAKKPAGKPAE